jgi:hypothetical protein
MNLWEISSVIYNVVYLLKNNELSVRDYAQFAFIKVVE